jgi:hypothetical protein
MPQVDLRAEGYTVIGDHLVQFFYEGKAAFYPRRKLCFTWQTLSSGLSDRLSKKEAAFSKLRFL